MAVIALLAGIELVLTGADLGLWGQRSWRAWAFVNLSFQPGLWSRGWVFWPGQWPGQWLGMTVTHVFVHVGFAHMLGNVLGLGLLVRLLGWMRPWVFLAIGLVSALGGAAAFWALAPAPASMTGASGAISGLAAFWGVRRIRQNPVRWKAVAAGLALLAGLAALEALPSITTAWHAHLGGAIIGAVLSPFWRMRSQKH